MITLENNHLKVVIDNTRGLKIMSYKDKRHEKEWVWTPVEKKDMNHQGVDLLTSFDSCWNGGWEEVFPNDAPCEFDQFNLVDHGEVWRGPWKIIEEKEHEVRGEFRCETMPFTLRKTIKLHPENLSLELQYQIINHSSSTLPYLFKFHPALKIEEGDRFIFPRAKMKPIALPFSRLLGSDEEMNYPIGRSPQGGPVNIEYTQKNDNYSREFVRLRELASGECALFNHRTNTELRLHFSLSDFPYVWLFQSYGGFMDHYVAMLEPTNASHYDLCHLQERDEASRLAAGEEQTLVLTISVRDL